MNRYYKNFRTKEDRTAWEKEQAAKNPGFKVCMRMTAMELEKEMHFPKGFLVDDGFKYSTIYRLDYDPVKGY